MTHSLSLLVPYHFPCHLPSTTRNNHHNYSSLTQRFIFQERAANVREKDTVLDLCWKEVIFWKALKGWRAHGRRSKRFHFSPRQWKLLSGTTLRASCECESGADASCHSSFWTNTSAMTILEAKKLPRHWLTPLANGCSNGILRWCPWQSASLATTNGSAMPTMMQMSYRTARTLAGSSKVLTASSHWSTSFQSRTE